MLLETQNLERYRRVPKVLGVLSTRMLLRNYQRKDTSITDKARKLAPPKI